MKFVKGFLAVFLAVFLVGGLLIAGAGWAYVEQQKQGLPEAAELKDYAPPIMTRIHAGSGQLIGEYATERRIFVPIEAIPPELIYAFISAEDKSFFEHEGVDYRGVARAVVANVKNLIKGRRPEGASTITQQVAKNFFLTNEVSLNRKLKEALLAFRIEETLTKAEILELYLNEIYLGFGAYGVASAALHYFDKSLNELTLSEVAYLAALPKAPNNYRPDRPETRARGIARRNWVLGRMAVNGFVPPEVVEAAQNEPLEIRRHERKAVQVADAGYFVEEVRRQLVEQFDQSQLNSGGLSVRTSLDVGLQEIAQRTLQDGLEAYDRRHGWRGPITHFDSLDDWRKRIEALGLPGDISGWQPAIVTGIGEGAARIAVADGPAGDIPLAEVLWARKHISVNALGPEITAVSDVLATGDVIWVERLPAKEGSGTAAYGLRQKPAVNGALAALDPHSGRILALAGGFSHEDSEFNRATQAWRQPGSAFKPIVYAAALDNGYTPATLVLDAPFVADQGAGQGLWRPENYSRRFYGPSTLRLGIEKSRNLMTVRLAQDLGMPTVARYAEQFGVVDDLPELLSMSLGAGETTVLRLTAAYAMFVNGGKRIEPSLVDRVQDRFGETIFRTETRSCPQCDETDYEGQPIPEPVDERNQVIDPRTAYQVTSMLEGVVERGTGRKIAAVGKPLAGKTGTTNEERDAWFVGFAPDLAVGVYVGFDEPAPLGRGETGSGAAAPIFRDFMRQAIGEQPAVPFRRPSGLRFVRINVHTGQLARASEPGAIVEAFRPGTEPTPYDGESRVIGAGEVWTDLSADQLEGISQEEFLSLASDYDAALGQGRILAPGENQEGGERVRDGTGGLY